MCRKFLGFSIALALLTFATSADSFYYFLEMRPFHVRPDLAPARLREKGAVFTSSFNVGEYLADREDYNSIIRAIDEKEEKKWNELQWGSLRLRFSRYRDIQLQRDAARAEEKDGLRGRISEFPLRFLDLTNRENLEAMGIIFSPRFDLGLEF
jgi:hypothetical protein